MRGAYLLRGIHELVDGDETSTDLTRVLQDYAALTAVLRQGSTAVTGGIDTESLKAADASAAAPPSVTGALLGSPILRSQGLIGQISSRKLTLRSGDRQGRVAALQVSPMGFLWRECRSLPSYISARSFAAAIIDLLVPDPAGQETMSAIQQSVSALPASMSTLRRSLRPLVLQP
jgi:hypothetical protein